MWRVHTCTCYVSIPFYRLSLYLVRVECIEMVAAMHSRRRPSYPLWSFRHAVFNRGRLSPKGVRAVGIIWSVGNRSRIEMEVKITDQYVCIPWTYDVGVQIDNVDTWHLKWWCEWIRRFTSGYSVLVCCCHINSCWCV